MVGEQEVINNVTTNIGFINYLANNMPTLIILIVLGFIAIIFLLIFFSMGNRMFSFGEKEKDEEKEIKVSKKVEEKLDEYTKKRIKETNQKQEGLPNELNPYK